MEHPLGKKPRFLEEEEETPVHEETRNLVVHSVSGYGTVSDSKSRDTKIDVEKIEGDISGNVSKLLKEIWKDHHENVVIMDGDMFFTDNFTLEEDMMYVPHYTNGKEWIWPNFMAFKKIPNPEELDLGFFPIFR
jgi:hypothetical protein